MTGILEMARSERYHAGLASSIARCLALPGANYEALARPAAHQIRLRYAIPDSRDVDAHLAPTDGLIDALAGDELFARLATQTVNRDSVLECWLVALRRSLARRIAAGDAAGDAAAADRRVAAMVAEQAFNNGYAFAVGANEGRLAKEAVSRLSRCAVEPSALAERETDFLLFALYEPLATLPHAAPLARSDVNAWPDTLRPLVRRALLGPVEEDNLKRTIPRITEIDDEVSRRVRAMYEENPYPRWLNLAIQDKVDVQDLVKHAYPHIEPISSRQGPLTVLMPGAGTCQHPLSVARNYRDCHVTAVDLSLSSLAYGKRMARRLGITNVELVQGDILSLPNLDRRFDHVECVGVLHHMRDPAADLRALVACLKPGGLMRIGLYGEAARRDVVLARERIERVGYSATVEGLRRFRQDVASGRHLDIHSLMDHDDFYSTSLLRDLVFHVHEHRFTMTRLRKLLSGSRLAFVGFEFTFGLAGRSVADVPATRMYREQFPHERTLADLANWERLERARPDLFAGYTFWCQKRPAR